MSMSFNPSAVTDGGKYRPSLELGGKTIWESREQFDTSTEAVEAAEQHIRNVMRTLCDPDWQVTIDPNQTVMEVDG